MIELKKEFKANGGIIYRQVEKNERFAIYECTQTFEDGSTNVYYEIFKIKKHTADRYHCDEYEIYPYDECFGIWAWCCSDYGSVVRVFEDDIDEDISKYAKIFEALRLQSLEMKKMDNYEGTYKLSPHIKSWSMYN